MSPWMIALTAYFAIGLIFAFAGPAARERRHQQHKAKLECRSAPRWKLLTLDAAAIRGNHSTHAANVLICA
jgi:hypothetical protein